MNIYSQSSFSQQQLYLERVFFSSEAWITWRNGVLTVLKTISLIWSFFWSHFCNDWYGILPKCLLTVMLADYQWWRQGKTWKTREEKKRTVLDGCKGVNRKEQLGWGGGGGLWLTILLKIVTRKILSKTERHPWDILHLFHMSTALNQRLRVQSWGCLEILSG